jgi:hypothetical protein
MGVGNGSHIYGLTSFLVLKKSSVPGSIITGPPCVILSDNARFDLPVPHHHFLPSTFTIAFLALSPSHSARARHTFLYFLSLNDGITIDGVFICRIGFFVYYLITRFLLDISGMGMD